MTALLDQMLNSETENFTLSGVFDYHLSGIGLVPSRSDNWGSIVLQKKSYRVSCITNYNIFRR